MQCRISLLDRLGVVLTSTSLDVSCAVPQPLSHVFISFEGIDGSGKSTQAHLIAEALRQRGEDVVLVREPGGTPLGEAIRTLVLEPGAYISPRAELLLFSAARAELVDRVITPALERGSVVIADRYIDSSSAYQGGGRGIEDPDWFEQHHAFVTSSLLPQRTYLIDLAPEEAQARRARREADRMESGDDEYYHRICTWYRRLALRHPDRIAHLDGAQPPDKLHRTILADYDAQP